MAGHSIPMTGQQIADRYFLEMRHKVLDIAAALDRIQRGEDGETVLKSDYRLNALRKAVDEFKSMEMGRAERVQRVFSDPTTEPIPAATTGKAHGAHNPES